MNLLCASSTCSSSSSQPSPSPSVLAFTLELSEGPRPQSCPRANYSLREKFCSPSPTLLNIRTPIIANTPPTTPANSSIRRRHFAAGIVLRYFAVLDLILPSPVSTTCCDTLLQTRKERLLRPSLETPPPKSDSFRLYLDLHSLHDQSQRLGFDFSIERIGFDIWSTLLRSKSALFARRDVINFSPENTRGRLRKRQLYDFRFSTITNPQPGPKLHERVAAHPVVRLYREEGSLVATERDGILDSLTRRGCWRLWAGTTWKE